MSVVYSCVMDRTPRFAYEAFVWANSLLAYGGQDPDSIVVHAVHELDPNYRCLFDSMRIKSNVVAPFDPRHSHSNKLSQLSSELLQSADYVVLCDCDTVFCESIGPWVVGDSVRAKVVDVANLSMEHWHHIFQVARLPLPSLTARSSYDNRETLPTYCNGGLLIIPQPIFRSLGQAWPKWDRWLLEQVELIKPFDFYAEQISFALSCAELELTVDLLPTELNFPTHLVYSSTADVLPPKVLHYHDRVDQNGFLLPTGVATVDRQIDKINDLVRRTRRHDFCNFLFWEYRYSQHPDFGSGIGSRGSNLQLKREILQAQIEALNPASVLDIGCGDLEVTRYLPPMKYTGVDISPASIALAQHKRPEWNFAVGDILDLNLQSCDLVICLDVVIHQSTPEMYEAFCRRLLDLSVRCLIVSGYNQPPWHTSEITFYHEPLSETLRRLAPGNMEIIGGYRDTTILHWSRAG